MSEHVKLKNVKLDKTVSITLKTSKGIMQGSKTLIKSEAQMFTNSTEDFYDELDDVAVGAMKEEAASAIYGIRNTYRLGRSAVNSVKKYNARQKYFKSYVNEKEKGEHDLASAERASYKKSDFYKDAQSSWKSLTKKEKQAYYKKVNPKMKQGFSLRSSAKKTISNQTRKYENRLNSRDDISDHIIGSTAKSIRYAKRTISTGRRMIRNFIPAIIHMFQGFISFVISIPALIGGLIALLPMVLVFIIAICLIMLVCSFEYVGRVNSFVENEVYYEYRYETNVVPDEILSITSALGWTTEGKEEYETLFALLDDARNEETWILKYDDMLDVIFNKYNPANYTWGDPITVKRENAFGWDTSEILTYEDYLALFPEYQLLSLEEKSAYGSDENIASLKEKARSSLGESGGKYANYFFNLETANFFKERPIHLEDIQRGSVQYKVGYRKMMNGAFHSGTDIPADLGTNVYAVADAKVIYSYGGATASGTVCTNETERDEIICGKNYGGNQVILQIPVIDKRFDTDSNLYVAYFHLNSVTVQTGDTVIAGERIGTVGDTGISFGSHLHLQAWLDTSNTDHMPYSVNNDDIEVWQRMIDATMLCDEEFRNYIYGR